MHDDITRITISEDEAWDELPRPARMNRRMLDALHADPEYQDGDRFIVLIHAHEEGKCAGVVGMDGYEDKPPEALLDDLQTHVSIIMETLKHHDAGIDPPPEGMYI